MMVFTLAEDGIPFNFFEEVDFDYQGVIVECLRQKFPYLSEKEIELFIEKRYDDLVQPLWEMRDSLAIDRCFSEKVEVDESTGTWGYFEYQVADVVRLRSRLAKEASVIVKEVLNEMEYGV